MRKKPNILTAAFRVFVQTMTGSPTLKDWERQCAGFDAETARAHELALIRETKGYSVTGAAYLKPPGHDRLQAEKLATLRRICAAHLSTPLREAGIKNDLTPQA